MNPFIAIAPMEGVVDAVLRDVLTRIGGVDRAVTEFIRVTDRVVPDHIFHRYCPELLTGGRTLSGIPVYIQLLGSNPECMALNAGRAAALGTPGIDLNFGCPAKTVNRHDGGATLLKEPRRLYEVISAVRRALPARIPLTAKVRLGFSHKDLVLDIARAAEDGGATALTVHARTKEEMYRPPAHWEYIARMREVVKIPLIANGEIWTVGDYLKCREISGCADVALGRGLVANPSLAREIRAHLNGATKDSITWSQLKENFAHFFFTSRSSVSGAFALSRAKQWSKLLSRTFPEAGQLFESIKLLRSDAEAEGVIHERCGDLHLDRMPLLCASQESLAEQKYSL